MESASRLDDQAQYRKFGRKYRGEKEESSIRIRWSSPRYVRDTCSKTPQAIIKITSFAKGAAARRLMEYVTRTDRDEIGIDAETDAGVRLRGKEDVSAVYREWAADFERKQPGRKNNPRHVTHMVLSAKTDNSERSVRKLHAASSQFLRKGFGEQGYQYLFVVHKDTQNPHTHVVIKNRNDALNKKLRIDKADLFDLRQQFARALNEHGLEAVCTLRRDRPEVVKGVMNRVDTIRKRAVMLDRRLRSTELPGVDTFAVRKYQLLALQGMRKTLKENSTFLQAERKEGMQKICDLQREIRKNNQALLPQKVKATVKYFEKESRDIAENIAAVFVAPKAHNKAQRMESRQRRRALHEYSKKYLKNLRLAAKDIRSNPAIPGALKKETLKLLATQKRAVGKLQSRTLSLGR